MGLRIKAGLLLRESSYFGANTKLASKVFEIDKMDNILFSWLTPSSDSGVGTPSAVMSVQEAQTAPATTSLRGIDFDYNHSNNMRKHYFISAESPDFLTAAGTTAGAQTANVNSLVTLSPISPYTLIV